MSVGVEGGNILAHALLSVTIDPASVAANTTAEQTFTVPGLKVGDLVFVNKPSLSAGLGICGARVSAADTLAVTFNNNTAAGIDAGSEAYIVLVIRAEGTKPGGFST